MSEDFCKKHNTPNREYPVGVIACETCVSEVTLTNRSRAGAVYDYLESSLPADKFKNLKKLVTKPKSTTEDIKYNFVAVIAAGAVVEKVTFQQSLQNFIRRQQASV